MHLKEYKSLGHSTHLAYRPDIDGLRAIAILIVVEFHAFPSALPGGFVGVDIFFVISGYLISSIIFRGMDRDDFSFTEFYARRIKRIFPALLVVLIACLVFGRFALFPDEFGLLGKHIAASAIYIQNFVLWKEAGYFDVASELKPLMHIWSLSIEEQFYLIYPFLVWAAWRAKLSVLAILSFFATWSFVANILGTGEDPVKTFYLPHTRFWELLAGSVLAYLHLFRWAEINSWLTRHRFCLQFFRQMLPKSRGDIVLRNIVAFLGLLLLATSVVAIDKFSPFPGWWAVLPVTGALLLIMAGENAWVNKNILASKWMVFIGLISYPLYLWHWPILSFLRIMELGEPSRDIRIAAVILSFLLAWLTYRLIEKPIRFGRKTWIKTVALTVSIGIVGYLGYDIYNSGGQKENFDELERAHAAFSQSRSTRPIERSKEAPIVLLGDSHAGPLAGGLEDMGRQVAIYSFPGCIPFYNVDRYDSRGKPGDCRAAINASIELIEGSDKFQTVILSSMGPVNLTGEAFMGQDVARVTGLGVTISGYPEITDRWKIYELGMRDTLRRLLEKNKNIIFVIDVPELGFHPKQCLDRPIRFTRGALREPCAVSRSAYEVRAGKYRNLVQKILVDFPQVKVLDSAKILCDKEWCWAKKDGQFLYRDPDHLSYFGAVLIGRVLNPMVREITKLDENSKELRVD